MNILEKRTRIDTTFKNWKRKEQIKKITNFFIIFFIIFNPISQMFFRLQIKYYKKKVLCK